MAASWPFGLANRITSSSLAAGSDIRSATGFFWDGPSSISRLLLSQQPAFYQDQADRSRFSSMPTTGDASGSKGVCQELVRGRWVLLLFHLSLGAYCAGVTLRPIATLMVWLMMQVGIHA